MLNNLLRLLIKNHSNRKLQKLSTSVSGFTMVELLVATIMATIIIVPILSFVVNLVDRDVKEQAKTNSQQELQAAVDYIAQDVSQAFYIYDLNKEEKTEDEKTAIDNFIDQLPHPPTEDTDGEKEPILVFWKRELVEDALAPSGDICESSSCNDTFVESLVAYYLIEDDNNTWCQPSGDTCPKRIGRFQIQDGVISDQGNYVCRDDDSDIDGRSDDCKNDSAKKKFQRDLGYTPYDNSNPIAWTKDTTDTYNSDIENYDQDVIVLVNYIEDFTLDSVTDNDLAKITIQGNALRRIQTNNTTCSDSSSYCPKTTAQVGGRSGFGE